MSNYYELELDRYYSVTELAVILGVNPETIRRWCRKGLSNNIYQACRTKGYRILGKDVINYLELNPITERKNKIRKGNNQHIVKELINKLEYQNEQLRNRIRKNEAFIKNLEIFIKI